MTMKHVATFTVPSTQSAIVISGIPQAATDLYVVASIRCSTKNEISFRINGNNTNFSSRRIQIINTTIGTNAQADNELYGAVPNSYTAGNFSSFTAHILGYSNTGVKSVYSEASTIQTSSVGVSGFAGSRWLLTDPVTSIELHGADGALDEFLVGSTVSLYTITAGSDGTTTI